MDLSPTPIPTTTKSPHEDTEEHDTPPHDHHQPIRPLSFTTKNHHHQPPSQAVVVTYKECMKNHAAALGGHAVDGCGEFMPSSSATAADPTSLKCAACGCHRNFHRREPDDPSPTTTISTPPFLDFRHPKTNSSPSPSPPPPPQLSHTYAAPSMLLSLRTAAPLDEHHHHQGAPLTPRSLKAENPGGRKRFRTKFSQEQKDKMQSFSEKLGWKLQKCDDTKVEEFCNEIGVAKGVLKVWMHNNKNNFSKRESSKAIDGRIISFEKNGHGIINGNHKNGSSSSS